MTGSNEPLGLRRGTVRAIVTLALVAVSAMMLFVPIVNQAAGDMFLLLTGIAVRDYFGYRAAETAAAGPALPDAVIGDGN